MVEIVGVLLGIATIVLAAWFWPHCARPCLDAAHARPAARRIVLAVTDLFVAAALIDVVARIALGPGRPTFWLFTSTGIVWALIVGAGFFTSYRWLIRATGGTSLS